MPKIGIFYLIKAFILAQNMDLYID